MSANEKEALRRMAESVPPRRMSTVEELRTFFRTCDQRETGDEPDWEDHQQVIQRSIRRGPSLA